MFILTQNKASKKPRQLPPLERKPDDEGIPKSFSHYSLYESQSADTVRQTSRSVDSEEDLEEVLTIK